MSLKKRLFRPPWEHKDAAARIRAVTEIDDPLLLSELPRLAREDEDPGVRLAALNRLDDEVLWLEARSRESAREIIEAADKTLARAVARRPDPELVNARLAWIEQLDDPHLVRQLAAEACDATVRRGALRRIDAQGYLGDRYMAEADEELAAEILERIQQESTLERIAQSLKRSSKTRSQAARKRLNQIRAAAGDPSGLNRDAEELCRQVEALVRGEGGSERDRQLETLVAAWKTLGSPPEELQRRFDGAVGIARSAIAGHAARSEPPTPPAAPDQPDEPSPPAAPDRSAEPTTPATPDQPAEPVPPASPDQPGDEPVQASRRAETTSEKKKLDVSELQGHLETAAAALDAGEITAAGQAIGRARSLLDSVPARQRPRAAAGELQRLSGRLREMRDWQHWSNNKLRERLIAQAEELHDADIHPDAITARLKEIRARWQDLEQQEAVPDSRRRYAAPPGQWRRFQAACKRAFEQARPYFETRQAVQEKSLAELREFIEETRKVLEDDQTPADTLTRHIRAARRAMRELDTLPPKARGKMAGRLRALIGRISKRLDAVFEELEKTKLRLIAEAQQLADEKNLDDAIRAAKRLMAEWKKTGAVRRKRENELWRKFRAPIDPLFDKLKARQEEKTAQTREELAELEELCRQAESLAAVDDDALEDAAARLSRLEKQWNDRHVKNPELRKRFKSAAARVRERLAACRQRDEQAAQERLESLAAALQDIWQTRLDESLEQACDRYLELVADRPDEDPLASELAARLRRFSDPGMDRKLLDAEVEANSEEARQVAVEMEFLAGLETTEEDRRRRMDYQVRRLSSRLAEGAPRPDLETELAGLIERRLKTFPRAPEVHAALEKRFETSKKSIQKMIGKE